MPLLAVDVGAGTQDILLYREDVPLEGSAKMIVPSQTALVAKRIDRARQRMQNVFLTGPTMGGGPFTSAVLRHLRAGLKVYATPSAAATINDNLDRVAKLGVMIEDEAPDCTEIIQTGDVDIPSLKKAFDLFGLAMPEEVAVAVQDHGFSPERSNRLFRFEHIAEQIKAGGGMEVFAYRRPPAGMTRMQAVKDYLEGQGFRSILMDTGPAALFGAALDPQYREPALIINFGNGHTVAALVEGRRIRGIFEHHTSKLDPKKLLLLVEKLCDGTLKNSEVFDDGGHGAYAEDPVEPRSVLVTGPKRSLFLGHLEGAVAASPAGDMMITGCIGLLDAWKMRESLWR
jgi:uncharacterized protein (DUF1786 family)